MLKIAERQHVDSETFHNDVVAANKPVVLRSLFHDWPAVAHCRGAASNTCQYLEKLDNGKPVYTIAAAPDAGGRFFYSPDLQGMNFKRGQIPLAQVLTQLLSFDGRESTHSIAVQALPVREVCPGFETENAVELLSNAVAPTMWIGNRGIVAPHYDVHRNLACVIAGRRHFILYPPEQIANLYPGPVLNAPGGVPISLVDPWNPDVDRFPRYTEAQAVAQEAILEPGDALYIPSLWWHGVAALDDVNVLVNYWWGGVGDNGISPNDCLLHGMLSIAGLDTAQRQAWRDFFDYFVFRNNADPAGHLPSGIEDIVATPSPEQVKTIRELLSGRLSKVP